MDYQQAWDFLDSLQFFKIKLGLDSMNRFLADLGNPHRQVRFVHIGGTNGKGSTGAALLSLLTTAGLRVGFYSSPHLSSVRERFRLGRSLIPEADFARHATAIRDVLNGRQITYFEFTTTLALLWFAEQQVDPAILEVGMGGRLDATNVVTPLVTVITNVSMDHEQYLGTTLTAVAGEKAGIIKPGIPVVSAAAADASREVIETGCARQRSPLYLLGRDFNARLAAASSRHWHYDGLGDEQGRHRSWENLALPGRGAHQAANGALALATLELLERKGFPCSEDQVRRGLAETRWPGRMEEFWVDGRSRVYWRMPKRDGTPGPVVHYLLDGAHNPAGVEALKKCLQADFSYENLHLIWAAMADKDLAGTLSLIAPLAATVILTRPESLRSATPGELQDVLPPIAGQRVLKRPAVEEAVSLAATFAGRNDLVCVAGSLYLVGRVRQILCGDMV